MFLLCRPFFKDDAWQNDAEHQARWGLSPDEFTYQETPEDASVMLLPFTVNDYHKRGLSGLLEEYSRQCARYGLRAYAFVAEDWGVSWPECDHITYFRMGGFRSQLSSRNQGFPAALSDHYFRLYGKQEIDVREKRPRPLVGFCGHASMSVEKRFKEHVKVSLENIKRALQNPTRKDWEPLFASAYQRASVLKGLADSKLLDTNFIYRRHYRAGQQNLEQLKKTTFEYYENLRQSDYIVCVRGGGNFSIRLYETLMMGRIPVFINTDCLLPQEDRIDWKRHVVWVEWADRSRTAEIVSAFHNSLRADAFRAMQLANRELWKNELSVAGFLRYIRHWQERIPGSRISSLPEWRH